MPTPPGFVSYSIELQATGDNEPYVVTFATEKADELATPSLHADRMHAAVGTFIMPRMWNGVTLTKVVARQGQDGGDDLIGEDVLAPVPGNLAGTFLPQNNALLVRKVSGLGGRRNQGRSYWPYLLRTTDVSNTGVVDGTQVADLNDRMDDFFQALANPVEAPVLTPVILHRGSALPPTPFVSYTVDSTVATQRGRLR